MKTFVGSRSSRGSSWLPFFYQPTSNRRLQQGILVNWKGTIGLCCLLVLLLWFVILLRDTGSASGIKRKEDFANAALARTDDDEDEDEEDEDEECKYCGDCGRSVYSIHATNRTEEADTSTVVLFLHIQKVGGTTLWKLLASMMPPWAAYSYKPFRNQMYWYPWELDTDRYRRLRNFDAIFGHFMFGIHNALEPSRGYCYITMLRHPVSRLISLWRFINSEYADQIPQVDVHGNPYSMMSFFDPHKNNTFQYQNKDNGMVRALCGPEAFIAPYGSLTDYHLDCALRNLKEHFSMVLITERYETSLQFVETVFGWELGTLPRIKENVTPPDRQLEDKSVDIDQVTDAIISLNALDIKLYNHAAKALDEQFTAARRKRFSNSK